METENKNPIAFVRSSRPRRRDQVIRRLTGRFARLSGLEDLRFRPALAGLARITLLLERSYQALRDRESLLNEDGELCSSINTVRMLAATQAGLLEKCNLTPSSISNDHAERTLDATFERIEKMKKVRQGASDAASNP